METVPLGRAAYGNAQATALGKEWTFYGQTQESWYGYPEIVSAKAQGLSDAPAGDKVIKLEHKPGDPAMTPKLFKTFTTKNWPNGDGNIPYQKTDGSPEDVSGRYITYLYIPSASYQLTSRGWINLVQLKEGYSGGGSSRTDPSWYVGIHDISGRPVLELSHWYSSGPVARTDATPYLDKWLKVEMRVYQGDRLEVYLNDSLFGVGRNSQYPVGRMYYPGSPIRGGGTVTRSEGWVFGNGNYSNPNDPASGSVVYVDLTTVLPLR